MAEAKRHSVNGLFAVALALYAVDFVFRVGLSFGQDAALGTTTLLLIGYVMLAVWAAFGVFRTDNSGQNISNLGRFLILSFITTFAPNLMNMLYKLIPSVASQLILGLALACMSQIWLWFIFFTRGDELWAPFYWLFVVYIFSLIIAIIYGTGIAATLSKIDIANGKGVAQQQMYIDIYSRTYSSIMSLVTTGKALQHAGEQQFNQTLAYATGDYYTGQVDQKATVPNKIDIKDLKGTQADFRDIDPVSVYATLTTETMDIQPPPTALITCSAGTVVTTAGSTKVFETTPSPAQVTLDPYDSWDVSCSWKEGTFKTRPPTTQALINMTATFDFITQAYLKTYWMDRNRLQELRAANQDPLVVYNIPDRNPITIYTNGPLKTGMRISSQPVQGLDRADTELKLGVTLDNGWEGKVVKFNSIVVFVPKAMRITGVVGQAAPPKQINCNDAAITASDKPSCDDTLDNIYYLEPTNVDASKFLTLLFNVQISAGDYDRLLSPAPVTARYFKTTVRYTYRLERALSIPITTTSSQLTTSGSTDTLPAQIVGIPTTVTQASDATMTYETNQLTKDKVTYYSMESGASFVDAYEDGYQSKNETTSHTIHISGLIPNTQYNYKITSVNANGIQAVNQGANYSFTTGAAS